MRAKKVDATHGAIRDYLRAAGWAVRSTATVGDDFPDLIVARRGFMAMVECKSKDGKLTGGQAEFRRSWPATVVVARTGEEAESQLDLAEKFQYLRKSL